MTNEEARWILKFHRPDRPRSTDRRQLQKAIDVILEDQRPQGEWIDHSEDGYIECPICNCLTNCDDNIDELHYCWNCGAKMRKGGAGDAL